MKPSLSWPQRFLRAVPQMSDGVWVGFLLAFVFGAGVLIGLLLCPIPSGTRPPSMQQQLDAMDVRLRALEQRLRQEVTP